MVFILLWSEIGHGFQRKPPGGGGGRGLKAFVFSALNE